MPTQEPGRNEPETDRRRPIAARAHPLSRRAAALLAGWRLTANAISLAGLALAILAALLLALLTPQSAIAWLVAAVLIEARLLCNMLDGMVAERQGTSSRLGALFNEAPDRFSDIAVLVGLGYATGGSAWLGFVAALAAVMTAYVNALGQALGEDPDFSGPMAKPQRMHLAAAAAILSFVFALAEVGQDDWPWQWGVAAWALALIALGGWATVLRRLLRLASRLTRPKS